MSNPLDVDRVMVCNCHNSYILAYKPIYDLFVGCCPCFIVERRGGMKVEVPSMPERTATIGRCANFWRHDKSSIALRVQCERMVISNMQKGRPLPLRIRTAGGLQKRAPPVAPWGYGISAPLQKGCVWEPDLRAA